MATEALLIAISDGGHSLRVDGLEQILKHARQQSSLVGRIIVWRSHDGIGLARTRLAVRNDRAVVAFQGEGEREGQTSR